MNEDLSNHENHHKFKTTFDSKTRSLKLDYRIKGSNFADSLF